MNARVLLPTEHPISALQTPVGTRWDRESQAWPRHSVEALFKEKDTKL